MTHVLDEVESLITALRKFELDIRRALSYGGGTHTYEYVCGACLSGGYDVFVLPNSVIIAELISYPQRIVYHQFVACGDLDEIIEAQAGLLVEEAKLRGASALTMTGRRGWLRALEPHGWKHDLVLMRKELTDGQDQQADADTGNRPSSRG